MWTTTTTTDRDFPIFFIHFSFSSITHIMIGAHLLRDHKNRSQLWHQFPYAYAYHLCIYYTIRSCWPPRSNDVDFCCCCRCCGCWSSSSSRPSIPCFVCVRVRSISQNLWRVHTHNTHTHAWDRLLRNCRQLNLFYNRMKMIRRYEMRCTENEDERRRKKFGLWISLDRLLTTPQHWCIRPRTYTLWCDVMVICNYFFRVFFYFIFFYFISITTRNLQQQLAPNAHTHTHNTHFQLVRFTCFAIRLSFWSFFILIIIIIFFTSDLFYY